MQKNKFLEGIEKINLISEDSEYKILLNRPDNFDEADTSLADASVSFLNINDKKFRNFFYMEKKLEDFNWFKSRQFYLGNILIIIISIFSALLLTNIKFKKQS